MVNESTVYKVDENSSKLTPRREKRLKKAEGMSEDERLERFRKKQERLNEVRRILCPTDEELSPELEDRPDCLIVASRFYPVEITLLLMQFLPPGRPFVVHSHILPVSITLYCII